MESKARSVTEPSAAARAVKQAEYSGALGARKREHCIRFTAVKNAAVKNARRRLDLELARMDEAVTCRRGCSHCCQHYVTATLAEGLVIVDFLYRNEQALLSFLRNYPAWLAKAGEACGNFDRLRSLARLTGTPVEAYRASVAAPLHDFAALKINCPFLTGGGDCAIYRVRPLSCAIHCSVDNPEKCAPASAEAPRCYDIVPDGNDLAAMARFWKAEWSAISLSMPVLVYGLLTRGQAFIDELTE